MAKTKKIVSMEDALWGACDKLRGTVEPAEYKHVVLSLIFLKFVNDKFEQRKTELINEGKEKYIDVQSFYTMKNVFFVPENSRWSYIIQNAKQDDIAIKIDTALNTIEKNQVYLERFFRNLILGENNELKNCYTHIDYDEYIKKFGENDKSSEIILELLKENPKLSAKKLSEKIGITSRAVEKQLASLVEKGFIKREGSPKGGHWEILK